MPSIILVRHSNPKIDPKIISSAWHLSEEGKHRALELAKILHSYQPDITITSPEPKAHETADILVSQFKSPLFINDKFIEHIRTTATYMIIPEFHSKIKRLFEEKSVTVFGDESGMSALERFKDGINYLNANREFKTTVVVTHATVMSLFLESIGYGDGYSIWRSLGLPCYCVLNTPDLKVKEFVPQLNIV